MITRHWRGVAAKYLTSIRNIAGIDVLLDGNGPRTILMVHGWPDTAALWEPQVADVSPGRPVTLMLHDWGCVFGYAFATAHPACVQAIVAADVGDAGSKAHVASLTRRIARWAHAPGAVESIGAHMNYPYHVQWTQGYGSKPFVPHCPMLFVYGTRKPFMFHSAAWLKTVEASPHGRVAALETGRWVTYQGAAEFNALVLEWLAGVALPTT